MINRCPACKVMTASVEFTIRKYRYARCKNCRTIFVMNFLDINDVYSSYEKMYFESREFDFQKRQGYDSYLDLQDSLTTSFEEKLRIVISKAGRGRLLDIGSAYGTFLKIASQHYDCTGMEISTYAARTARQISSTKTINGNIEEAPFLENQFDVITMWDVIEHLRRPISALQEVRRLLKPGGYCFISTDDANHWMVRLFGRSWWAFAPPLHLCHFSKKGLITAAQLAGGLEMCDLKPDQRTYRLHEIIRHLGVSYQSRFLQGIGGLINHVRIGRMALSVQRPEQFLLILQKDADSFGKSC